MGSDEIHPSTEAVEGTVKSKEKWDMLLITRLMGNYTWARHLNKHVTELICLKDLFSCNNNTTKTPPGYFN